MSNLVLPWKNPKKWEGIPGTDNCLGRDLLAESLFNISSCNSLLFGEKERIVAFGFELLKQDSMGRPMLWVLWPGACYRAILPEISMPLDCYAIISPRSTLSKVGIICLSAAMVDPGFQGKPQILMVSMLHVKIEPGVPLFSMRMYQESDLHPYNGYYQGRQVNIHA